MPDHWGFVAMAYGLAVVVLAGYWRRLARLEREAGTSSAPRAPARRAS